jgi:hypothetical protein
MPLTREDERLWREGEEALQQLLATLSRERSAAEAAGDADRVTIVNAVQYATIFNYDLRQLLVDIKRAGHTWGGRLYVRLLALTLYECTEDLRALLGRPLRDAVARLGGNEAVVALNPIHERATRFFEANRPLLLEIRLQVIGHREHDADLQLKQLQALDVDQLTNMGYEMVKWLTEFHGFSADVAQLVKKQAKY